MRKVRQVFFAALPSYFRVVVVAGVLVSVPRSSLIWTHFTGAVGTDLETIWPSVESSYSGASEEIGYSQCGALVAVGCEYYL